MPYQCDPCVCPEQHYRDSMSWRKAMITLLCRIAGYAASIVNNGIFIGGAGAEVTNLYAAVAFGSLTNGFVAAITDSHEKLGIVIDNETNEPIEVSFNGTDVQDYLTASSASIRKLGELGRYETGNIYLRYASGAPTVGSVIVSAFY